MVGEGKVAVCVILPPKHHAARATLPCAGTIRLLISKRL